MISWVIQVQRSATGEPNQYHGVFLLDQDPLWTDPQITIDGVEYDANSYHKWGVLSFLDMVTGERVFFPFDVSVPPFNGTIYEGDIFHIQTHSVAPPPPPPQPPPTQPPPIQVGPPTGPPFEEPLEPIPPDQPPWKDGPPPTFGPPDRPHPPPRLTNDFLTWNAFVAKYGDRVQRWALEVPLDYGDLPPDPNAPENYKRMWQRLTGHKADAFIDFGHVIYVAEVKPRLTLAALGQAYFGYQLAVKRYRFNKPVKPCVICSTAPHTLLPIAAQNGITVFVLEGITGEKPE